MVDSDDLVRRTSVLIDEYHVSRLAEMEQKKENNFIYDALFKIAPIMYVIAFLLINMFVWRLFEPDWNYAESIYFICASLTTVGYGDRVPSSSWGRLYCIVFLILSITTVFPIISDGMDKALHLARACNHW